VFTCLALAIVGLLIFVGGLIIHDSETAVAGLAVVVVFLLLAVLFNHVDHQTKVDEKKCLDRGGQVVHYGQYGNKVDCIFLIK